MEYQFESMGPTIRVVVLVFMIVFAIVLVGFVILMAALPGWIAASRNHPQAAAVNICGWVGLPTGILWAVAMVWAFWIDQDQRIASSESTSTMANPNLAAQLDQLEYSLNALELARESTRQGN